MLLPAVNRACSLIDLLVIHISRKHLPNIQVQSHRSLLKMVTPMKWEDEKKKMLLLSTADRRKAYKDYVTIDQVVPWSTYIATNKDLKPKSPTPEDLELFKKFSQKTNPDLHKTLSEKVSIFKGDITKLEVDAIVNAANSRLIAGGGVDGAIHRAAGPYLQLECNSLAGCPTGEAKITGGYQLPAKYVIHTVGPQDKSESKLQSCYEKCFSLSQEHKLKSIAFPCISTGIYGFPNRLAGHIAMQCARTFLENNSEMEQVVFCTFMAVDVDIYETLMEMYFPCKK